MKVSTGVGKTRIAAELIAEDIERMRGDDERRPWLVAVPTHKLGGEVEELFTAAGVLARVFRGRTADDPDAPDTGIKMCLDIEAVELALQLGRPVSTSCCKGKHPDTGTIVVCPLFYDCAYQRQIRDTPEVWIGSHELLFSAPGGLGNVAGIVIDEGFWQAGIKGGGRGLTLDDLGSPPPMGRNNFEDAGGGRHSGVAVEDGGGAPSPGSVGRGRAADTGGRRDRRRALHQGEPGRVADEGPGEGVARHGQDRTTRRCEGGRRRREDPHLLGRVDRGARTAAAR